METIVSEDVGVFGPYCNIPCICMCGGSTAYKTNFDPRTNNPYW